jgi:hypothetical protein
VSSPASRIIVVAGALTQPHWVPPAEIRARLPRTATLAGLRASTVAAPRPEGALPRELAHDRWLREQLARKAPAIAPGAMAAVRQLALRDGTEGPPARPPSRWLLEPAHFHLAKDHLVLVAGAAQDLSLAQARELAQAIEPLLAAEGMTLTVAAADRWLLGETQAALQLDCAASEAAAGRNVDGYLPSGPDARRYRRLLNEIQMTWHEHPVNEARADAGALPINSVWLSGPVTGEAVAALREDVAAGSYRLEQSLLGPRLRDDRSGWLDALQALDAQLHGWLTSPQPPGILLCGDDEARWLERGTGSMLHGLGDALGNGIARLRGRLRQAGAAAGRARAEASSAGSPIADPLAQLFTESH